MVNVIVRNVHACVSHMRCVCDLLVPRWHSAGDAHRALQAFAAGSVRVRAAGADSATSSSTGESGGKADVVLEAAWPAHLEYDDDIVVSRPLSPLTPRTPGT